ncbi:MAG: hypothetical protein K9N29_11705 [Candidatus Marinimicrobia bacterium]|nr:hypothetical protein [Candidatus Neomarinimicrobiota bacterium]
MNKKLVLFIILGMLGVGARAQEILPVSNNNILIFIEPFENHSPRAAQSWLSQGFPGFLKSGLTETDYLYAYSIPDFANDLVDRPHKLQDLIWKSVFQREVDPGYESYLVLGSYSYIEGELTVQMDLLSLRDTRVLAHFQEKLPYTKLLTWKSQLSKWILSSLRLQDDPALNSNRDINMPGRESTSLPGVALKDQLTTLFDTKKQNESEDLQRKYEQQSRMKLGAQLEALWHDIAYDPYLATIHDIHTLRLQSEPDSVLVNFKVGYRINPRILDEIEHFSKTRAGLVGQTESFEGHAFMDLGYIDADFTREVASGDWQIVPIITMGSEDLPFRRVFYYSFPRPIESPGEYYYNQGKFKQLLLAIPGVDALRIFAQESQQEYEYSIVVGYDEIKKLDKIQVKFVAEQDLADHL